MSMDSGTVLLMRSPAVPLLHNSQLLQWRRGDRVSSTVVSWESGLQIREPPSPWHLANW